MVLLDDVVVNLVLVDICVCNVFVFVDNWVIVVDE